jgi:subtilisin family serine protease
MSIDKLWKYSEGESQIVAFIDTGVNLEYAKELENRIVYKYNIIGGSNDVTDYHGHGTEMVSVACGHGYEDVYGIAPKSKIIIIKGVSDEGKTNNEYLYKALECARDNGATVVCVSLGGFKEDEKVIEIIQQMIDEGITIVASAGDYSNRDLLFPANQEGVISVEALAEDGAMWERSNSSSDSVLRFPGDEIETICPYNEGLRKEQFLGTSEACAIASGYVALIKDYYKGKDVNLSNDKLVELLQELKTKSGKAIDYLKPFK